MIIESYDDITDIMYDFLFFLFPELEDKIIVNYQNEDVPELPYIGLYIESADIDSSQETESTEEGLKIISTADGSMYLDFYGNSSSYALGFKKALLTDEGKAKLKELGMSIITKSNISNLTKAVQDTEHIERHQIIISFNVTSEFIDTSANELTEVEIEFEFKKDGLYTGDLKPELNDIVEFIT